MEVKTLPIPIVAKHNAQPTKAWARIIIIFLVFTAFSWFPLCFYDFENAFQLLPGKEYLIPKGEFQEYVIHH
jgi:hypothetical protein